MTDPIRCVACSIFRAELSSLPSGLADSLDTVFLDSILHMRPAELDQRLRTILDARRGLTLLVYGDCCPSMLALSGQAGKARTQGINCSEIMLGHERYRELRRQGSFFFMPEWVGRWEQVFRTELGLSDRELARRFMRESMRRLVYLDTGAAAVPHHTLEELESYFGLPMYIEVTGVKQLAAALRSALRDLGADR